MLIILNDRELDLEVRKSKRAKRLKIEFISQRLIRLVLPFNVNIKNENELLNKFIFPYKDKILKKLNNFENINFIKIKKHSYFEINEFKRFMLSLTKKYLEKLNLSVNKVFFRNQKTKLGSCSSKKNISYNLRLIDMPEFVQEYVVVHEVVHLKHLNHSLEFKKLVKNIYSKTNDALRWLKKNKIK